MSVLENLLKAADGEPAKVDPAVEAKVDTAVDPLAKLDLPVDKVPFDVSVKPEAFTPPEIGSDPKAAHAWAEKTRKIKDLETGKVYSYCKDGKPGPISTKIYEKLVSIQYGEEEDVFGWTEIIIQ